MNSKIIGILEKLGLNGQESRAYLTLLKLKGSQTGDLCKKTNIASSRTLKNFGSIRKSSGKLCERHIKTSFLM